MPEQPYRCRCETCQCHCITPHPSFVCWLCRHGHHKKQKRSRMPVFKPAGRGDTE